jgi:surface antigen
MNRTTAIGMLTMMVIPLTGCATHTGTGAGVGGLAGAATGAAIGSATGNAGAGALIGAALGTVGGAAVGSGLDENDRRNEARWAQTHAALNAQPPVSINDVVNLTRNGVSEDTIIAQIRTTGSTYRLSADDIIYLRSQGVTERVTQSMLAAPVRSVRPVVYERPVVYDRPVYVVEPMPPPPVHVGFGFYHGHRHCRW